MKKNTGGQVTLSVGLGSGPEASQLRDSLGEAAKGYGYSSGKTSGVGRMVREMVLWILEKGIWERGKGLVDLKDKTEG